RRSGSAEAGAQHRRQLARGNPGRHRPGQAPGRRGGAPLRARAPAGGHHRRGGGRADLGPQRPDPDPGQRRPGGAAGAVSRPAARRPDHRRHAHGPRPGGAHRRSPGGPAPAPARAGTSDQRRSGRPRRQAPGHAPGHRHPQRAWRAGPAGRRSHGGRRQH
ncbi:hypothetical protein OY671_011631, partial [Metschnikowia pulcherrima]